MPWIETYTGKFVDPVDLEPDDVCIEDIAHHLSLLCRFNGACKVFYSVAQHSILTSLIVPRSMALEALLHDAAEAYIGDITRPLKHFIPDLEYIENSIMEVISEKFCLKELVYMEIKEADNTMLSTEARELMVSKGKDWEDPNLPLPEGMVTPMSNPAEVEELFLKFFNLYTKEREECQSLTLEAK